MTSEASARSTDVAARWRRFAAAVIVLTITLPGIIRSAGRNWAYLQILHAVGGEASDRGSLSSDRSANDDLLGLRRALALGDWPSASRILTATAGPDRLAALLVLREADRRVDRGDNAGARTALSIVDRQTRDDVAMWYLLGSAYEHANLPEEAIRAYRRGDGLDPTGPWSDGRYRIAMIYQRQGEWRPLVDLLGPLFARASAADFGRQTQQVSNGGPIWQGTFLALGLAYEQLGSIADAEAVYERVSRLPSPSRDWTLNKMLVALSRLKRGHGDLVSAQQYVVRAIDLATEFDASYRRAYETDTAAEAGSVVDQARRELKLSDLQKTSDVLVEQLPQSPGAWYFLGLVREAACDLSGAKSAYAHAQSAVRRGAGSFLEGRPATDAARTCEPRG